MTAPARDRGARSRIREYLALHGPIEDSAGGATAVLKEAVEYEGQSVAFIQLVAAMDRDGEIEREIRGKRTYKITSTAAKSATSGVPAPATVGVADIDYSKLARALIVELTGPSEAGGITSPAADEVRELVVERDRLQAERDEYAAKLAEARKRMQNILGEFGEEFASAGTDEDAEKRAG